MSLYESSIHEELVRIREVLALSALIKAGQDKRPIVLELEKHCFPERIEQKWMAGGSEMDPQTGELLIGMEKVSRKWIQQRVDE